MLNLVLFVAKAFITKVSFGSYVLQFPTEDAENMQATMTEIIGPGEQDGADSEETHEVSKNKYVDYSEGFYRFIMFSLIYT